MYKDAQRLSNEGKIVLIDRGLPGDLAFSHIQKEKGVFTDEEFEVCLDLITERNIPVSTVIIYLDCTAETSWKMRIEERKNL